MERRKRVHQILGSKDFCRELEKLVQQESLSGQSDPERLKTLQKLSELTISRGQMAVVNLHNSLGLFSFEFFEKKRVLHFRKCG